MFFSKWVVLLALFLACAVAVSFSGHCVWNRDDFLLSEESTTSSCSSAAALRDLPAGTVVASCAVKDVLSTAFALRTPLANVCSFSHCSGPTCLALLLLDSPTHAILNTSSVSEENAAADVKAILSCKDHPDLGFLPRVSVERFAAMVSFVASAALPYDPDEGGLVILPGLFGVRSKLFVSVVLENKEVFVVRLSTPVSKGTCLEWQLMQ